MKRILFVTIMAIGFMFGACNNSSKEDTHTHDDGSTHSDHDTTKPKQHEFKVSDTTNKKDTGNHTHDDGTKHSH